jgi:prepilin-type N-terminal cleavage/methylation domain-containing protein
VKPRSTPNSGRAGFSLVELLAVVVIIGLIAGLVAVEWNAILPRAKLNSEVHKIAAAIHGARSEAIARNAVWRIYYDLDGNGYEVSTPFRVGGGLAQRIEERMSLGTVGLPAGIEISRVLIDGVEYTEGKVFVRFDPLGSATDHSITITQRQYEAIYTIEVLPLTGLVRFHYEDYHRLPVTEDDFN